MYQQITTTLRVARRETPEVVALDLSLFFILSDDGLRVSELPTLTIGDWDLQAQTSHIRHGKGGHECRVPVTAWTAQPIEAHLADRRTERQAPFLIRQGQALSTVGDCPSPRYRN
jgi:site-specific recombinase XerC